MRCGKPVEKEEQEFCADCSRHEAAFEQGRSLWIHKEPVSSAIYRLKYKNKRYYGEIFAEELVNRFSRQIRIWGIQEIVPVPLHKKRMKKRGYNQAAVIADVVAGKMNIPVKNDAVRRVVNTKPMKELDDTERIKNLKNAFCIAKGYIPKQRILIIDDIFTTGNTIHRVAETLKNAGAEKVYFLTISIGQGL